MRGNGEELRAERPDSPPVALRPGGPADAPSAAALHAALIAEGFLSSLGPRFLRRLYGRITRCEGSFLLIAEDGGAPVGFIAGSVAVGRLYRSFLARDGVGAALAAPLRLVTALPRVLETLRHGRGDADSAGGELLAVAVDPAWRGRNVGGRLVEAFLEELGRRAVTSAHVLVGADNARAIAMYRRAGFSAARTVEMHRGTESVLMARELPTGAVPSAPTGP